MDYVVMPKNDWQEVLDATRERTGDSSLLRSGDVGAQIRAIASDTPSGTRRITENGTYDVTGYASAEVEVETPTEELSVTENGEYTPPAGKHFSKVTVNVEAEGGGTSEDLTAELSEQDALLTEIEAMLEENGDSGSDSGGSSGGESAVLTVNFASEYENWENSEGEMVYNPSSATGSYTVDGANVVYFESVSSLEIPCAVGSVVEIIYAEYYDFGRLYRDAQGVDVEKFYVDDEYGDQIDWFRITVTESDASVTLYDIYG